MTWFDVRPGCDHHTLYDLTNTYFEGIAAGVAKAKRGRSKVERVGLTGVAGEELHAPHEAAGV